MSEAGGTIRPTGLTTGITGAELRQRRHAFADLKRARPQPILPVELLEGVPEEPAGEWKFVIGPAFDTRVDGERPAVDRRPVIARYWGMSEK